MPRKSDNYSTSYTFDIKDYLDATNDAASKTRTVTIVLVVASVLMFIGYYNSLPSSWMAKRLKATFASDFRPNLSDDRNPANFDVDKYKEQLQQQVVKDFSENVRTLKIPFFGVVIDINDLGAIGGLALVIILMMLRFCLSREVKNLTVSFREAVKHNQLTKFYNVLAMRQVFTLPRVRIEERRLLIDSVKSLYVLPALIFLIVVSYDYFSVFYFAIFTFREVPVPLLMEIFWLMPILYLSLKCLERQKAIDHIWDENWKRIENEKSSIIRLDEDLIEEFGNDKIANKALRKLLKNC